MRSRFLNSHRLAQLALVIAAAALVVRLSVKDRFVATGVVYYGFPLPVIAGLLVMAAAAWLRNRKYAPGLAVMGLAVFCVVAWCRETCYSNPPRAAHTNRVRILLWNAGRPHGDPSEMFERLAAHRADVMVLVESGDAASAGVVPSLSAGFNVHDFGGGITVIARGAITQPQLHKHGTRNRIAACIVTLEGGPLPFLVVDLDSNPLVSRRESLRKVTEMQAQAPALVVLGDFNTPSDSVWFDDLRRDFLESFEAAGSGLHATWPSYLPILAIDHIWVHRSLETCSSAIITTFDSDHRIVLADVQWPASR